MNRFIDNGDGTITDTTTNLIWCRRDSYADLGISLNWEDAKNYVAKLTTGGKKWRLPTIEELQEIYNDSYISKSFTDDVMYYDPILKPEKQYGYWTIGDNHYCFNIIYFINGKACDLYQEDIYSTITYISNVRAVAL